jgi:hypothetical protein
MTTNDQIDTNDNLLSPEKINYENEKISSSENTSRSPEKINYENGKILSSENTSRSPEKINPNTSRSPEKINPNTSRSPEKINPNISQSPKKINPKIELPRYRFIVTTLITFCVMIFSFIMISKTDTDDPTFSIWVGFITYILGYYTPSPKEHSKKKNQPVIEPAKVDSINEIDKLRRLEEGLSKYYDNSTSKYEGLSKYYDNSTGKYEGLNNSTKGKYEGLNNSTKGKYEYNNIIKSRYNNPIKSDYEGLLVGDEKEE